jgi:hypothetical protein
MCGACAGVEGRNGADGVQSENGGLRCGGRTIRLSNEALPIRGGGRSMPVGSVDTARMHCERMNAVLSWVAQALQTCTRLHVEYIQS